MKTLRDCAVVVSLIVLIAGCGKPTAQDRDNRRVVDCILTAITLRNARLLEDDARWAAQRHDDGQLSDEAYQGLKAVIEKALRGDWLAAEEDGYRFRELHPFVEPGH